MPGTPATSPRLGAPRISNSDDFDIAGDLNAAVDAIDANAAVAREPLLTAAAFIALPAQIDGTVVRVQLQAPTASVPGINVRLRLNKASTNAAKWEVDGESPELVGEATAAATPTTSTTYVTPSTAVALTLPLGGIAAVRAYSGQFGVTPPSGLTAFGLLSYSVGGTGAADADAAMGFTPVTSSHVETLASVWRPKVVTAGMVLTPRVRASTGTTTVLPNNSTAGIPYGVAAKYLAVVGPAAV